MVKKEYFNYIFIVFVSLFFIISEKLFAGKDQWNFTGDMFLSFFDKIRPFYGNICSFCDKNWLKIIIFIIF